MTRIEEINAEMFAEFEANGFEDTTENRIAFLEGLRDAWNEDEESNFEKTLYQLALMGEIFRLQVETMFPRITGT